MSTGKGPLRIAIEDFLSTFGFGPKVAGWIKSTLETMELEAIQTYEDMVNALDIAKYLPPNIQPGSLRALTKHQVALLAVLFPLFWQILEMFAQLFVGPFMRPLNYFAEALAHTKHPDSPTVLQMLRRRPDLEAQLKSLLVTGGYDDISLQGFTSLIDQYLTPTDYIRSWLRGELDDNTLTTKLSRLGYLEDDIERLMKLGKIIPTPSDLVTMAVKEAFDDNLSGRFQHDEGFPADFGLWAEKQGLSEDWAHKFWRAHWQLPSPNQVFEMLQRLRPGVSDIPVTDSDVAQYLKMADYSPFWRDRLAAISHPPFTRVDVRRMYKVGTLNEAQVKEAYLDLGYDDEKAQALTQFTIAYEAEEETGIVRSSVISAYGSGMIDRGTAEKMLGSGGYDPTTIAFYLDNEDFKDQLQVNQIKLNNIHQKYLDGLLDETTVNNEINALNLPGERVTALLELWNTERLNQVTQLTITQMETLLEKGIVTADDYKKIARIRGYSDESINWTLQRIALEASEAAQTKAEKAEADNERLQKSKTSSQYQKDKSSLDLAIAQAKAEITDIDVALHGEVSDEDKTALGARKDELKQFISQMNVAKAQLRFDVQDNLNKLVG